jgi:osmotically inducible protein OsmC
LLRAGHVKSSDGLIDVDRRRPVQMGGPGGATNPEELFFALRGNIKVTVTPV